MSTINGHLDQTQDGWVKRLVEVSDLFRHSVGSHRVLNQVIGTDREEVRIFCEFISQNSRCRNLDHHTDLDAVRYGDAFRLQFFFGVKNELFALLNSSIVAIIGNMMASLP